MVRVLRSEGATASRLQNAGLRIKRTYCRWRITSGAICSCFHGLRTPSAITVAKRTSGSESAIRWTSAAACLATAGGSREPMALTAAIRTSASESTVRFASAAVCALISLDSRPPIARTADNRTLDESSEKSLTTAACCARFPGSSFPNLSTAPRRAVQSGDSKPFSLEAPGAVLGAALGEEALGASARDTGFLEALAGIFRTLLVVSFV